MSGFTLEYEVSEGEWLLSVGRRQYSYYRFWTNGHSDEPRYYAWVKSDKFDTRTYAQYANEQGKKRRHRGASPFTMPTEDSVVYLVGGTSVAPAMGWIKSSPLSFLLSVGKDFYETLPPQLRQVCEKEKYADTH